jgi:hypothetical protein
MYIYTTEWSNPKYRAEQKRSVKKTRCADKRNCLVRTRLEPLVKTNTMSITSCVPFMNAVMSRTVPLADYSTHDYTTSLTQK